jgi:hypothetical protein
MRTNVYVGGFNLYYGCLKGTPYQWLDVAALCARLLPRGKSTESFERDGTSRRGAR